MGIANFITILTRDRILGFIQMTKDDLIDIRDESDRWNKAAERLREKMMRGEIDLQTYMMYREAIYSVALSHDD